MANNTVNGRRCDCYQPEIFGHTSCPLAPPIPEWERDDTPLADPEGQPLPEDGQYRARRRRRLRLIRRTR